MKKLALTAFFISSIFFTSCSKEDKQETLSKEKPKPAFGTTAPAGHLKNEK